MDSQLSIVGSNATKSTFILFNLHIVLWPICPTSPSPFLPTGICVDLGIVPYLGSQHLHRHGLISPLPLIRHKSNKIFSPFHPKTSEGRNFTICRLFGVLISSGYVQKFFFFSNLSTVKTYISSHLADNEEFDIHMNLVMSLHQSEGQHSQLKKNVKTVTFFSHPLRASTIVSVSGCITVTPTVPRAKFLNCVQNTLQ